MSYLKIPIKIEVDAEMEYRIVGPSDTEPTPADGFQIDPEPIEVGEGQGKFWLEYRIITP